MGIRVGEIPLSNRVLLAPMSGVSDLPFRRLVKRRGAALVVSEMIASEAMVRQNAKTLHMARNEPEEFPMAVQLAGCEPKVMADAGVRNVDLWGNMPQFSLISVSCSLQLYRVQQILSCWAW